MGIEIEILEQFYAAINRYDIQAVTELFDPGVIRNEPDDFPSAGTYRGIPEVQDHIKEGRGSWAEGSCDPEEFFVKEDMVVVYVHAWVRLHGATDWSGGRFADVFAIRDGKITEWHTFEAREDALKWAGIEAK